MKSRASPNLTKQGTSRNMRLSNKIAMIPSSCQLVRLRIKGSVVMFDDTLELLAEPPKF